MPKRQSRSSQQIKRDRSQLRKLRDSGLYSGKVDLRKKPAGHLKAALKRYADVIAGRAKVLSPKDPKSYKDIFKVVNGKVIVPKKKDEKVTVSKKGEIQTTRKVGSRTVKSTFKRVKEGEKITRKAKGTQYAVPFIRGRKADGTPNLHWFRFPDYDSLKKFMAGYDYKGWKEYVVEEDVEPEEKWLGASDLDAQAATGAFYRAPKGAGRRHGKRGIRAKT